MSSHWRSETSYRRPESEDDLVSARTIFSGHQDAHAIYVTFLEAILDHKHDMIDYTNRGWKYQRLRGFMPTVPLLVVLVELRRGPGADWALWEALGEDRREDVVRLMEEFSRRFALGPHLDAEAEKDVVEWAVSHALIRRCLSVHPKLTVVAAAPSAR